MSRSRIVVLISGHGSNLQTLIDACQSGRLPAQIVAVISNKENAYGLERARQAGIPAIIHTCAQAADRTHYDHKLRELAASYQPDWIVLAGWMHILSPAFLDGFPGRVVNLHPALPGSFPGTHAIQRAHQAYERGEINHTGVMVHLVPDGGVDDGPVVKQAIVEIHAGESLEELEQRVHRVEHRLLIDALCALILSP
jgi:phosphoribosylglycinamide formyltransferase-1